MIKLLLFLVLSLACRIDQYTPGEFKSVTLMVNGAVVSISASIVNKGGWDQDFAFYFIVDGISSDSVVCQVFVLEIGKIIEQTDIVIFGPTYKEFWSRHDFEEAHQYNMGWSARIVEAQ